MSAYTEGRDGLLSMRRDVKGGDGTIVLFEPALHMEARAFQARAYPSRRRSLAVERWDWMFLRSAERLGLRPRVWYFRNEQGLQAQRGGIPVLLQCPAGTVMAIWFVETIVLPHLRGRSVGRQMIAHTTRATDIGLSLGQSAHVISLQDELGWRSVASTRSWLCVLRPRDAFRGRLRGLMRWSVAWAAYTWSRLRRASSTRPLAFDTGLIDRFDERHDRLWAAVRQQYTCVVVRDAAYLNWKYVEQPGQSFIRTEVRGPHGEARGVCVWVVHAPDQTHAYRRAWILDMVVDHQLADEVTALVDAVIVDAASRDVDVIEMDLHGAELAQHLVRLGWIRGRVTRHLRVCWFGGNTTAFRSLSAPAGWFVTRGDSDGDHPWWTPDAQEQQA